MFTRFPHYLKGKKKKVDRQYIKFFFKKIHLNSLFFNVSNINNINKFKNSILK